MGDPSLILVRSVRSRCPAGRWFGSLLAINMNWWKQFKPKACAVKLKAGDQPGVLTEIVDNMVKAGVLDDSLKEDALKALLEREELASTGIGMAVAIPHVKLAGITKAVCTLSVHQEGLEWAAIDGEPVRMFFTVLRPTEASEHHDPDRHLDMMRWITKLAREPDFRSFATRTKTKTELVGLLKEMSAV